MQFNQTKTFDQLNHGSTFDTLIKYAIAPRPICFASTINKNGIVNLSPFSYFNFVSQTPAICVFSPLTRVRDGSKKHTLENIREVPEVVINIVNYNMVQQQSLASTEFPRGVNEFEKTGLTPIPSKKIKPPRVKESPIQLECKVIDIIEFGKSGGAGNLVISEVLCMHVQSHLLDKDNKINQAELDLVARLGADWYCRVTEDNLFQVPKPLRKLGVGVDQLPADIRTSSILSGNHLGMLANVELLPKKSDHILQDSHVANTLAMWENDQTQMKNELHRYAGKLLDEGDLDRAWQVLLQG